MTSLPLLAAFVAQALPAPAAPPAPRSLAVYDLQSREGVGRKTLPESLDPDPETPRSFDVTALYVAHASLLTALDSPEVASTPTARLLAGLVEEEARRFDPTVRCIARGSTIAVDSTASEEARVRDLLRAASVSSRERNVVLEVRFLLPGPKSAVALEKAGISCTGTDGGARVQATSLTTGQIDVLLREDGERIEAPGFTAPSGKPFHVRQLRQLSLLTDWNVATVEDLGNVVVPSFTRVDDGMRVEGAALVLARAAEEGGDRIALELDLSSSAVARPIPREKRVLDGKEFVVQVPTVKRASLIALFTLAPGQRVVVAGLARPTFAAGDPPRPVLVEVVARVVAIDKASSTPDVFPIRER